MEKKKRLTAYNAAFKLQVVAYAEQNGKRAAGRNFHVDDKCVRRWCDQKEELATTNKTRKAFLVLLEHRYVYMAQLNRFFHTWTEIEQKFHTSVEEPHPIKIAKQMCGPYTSVYGT